MARSSDVIGSVVKGLRSQGSAGVLTFPFLLEDSRYSSTIISSIQAARKGRIQITLVCVHQRSTPHFFFGQRPAACGILVPRPGIEPMPHALEDQSLNHWTTREVLSPTFK